MVGHDDAVHAGVYGRVSVGHRLDALDHDGTFPIIAEEREVLPRAEQARVGLSQPRGANFKPQGGLFVARREAIAEPVEVEREGWPLVGPHRDAQALHEYGIGCADLRADASGEGEVRGLEVMWPPAEQESVQSEDERGEARRLGAAQNRERHVVAPRPIQKLVLAAAAWG